MKFVKILAVAVMMMAGMAHAELKPYTTFEYSQETKRADDAKSDKGGIVVGVKDANWDYSIKSEYSQDRVGDGNSTGVEGRAKYTFAALPVLEIRPYVGARVGEKFKDGANFSHYAVDYGVKLPVIGHVVYLDVGGRYRNAFNTEHDFQSSRAQAQLSWNVTSKDTVAVRYSKAYGDVGEEKNAYRVSYTRSF